MVLKIHLVASILHSRQKKNISKFNNALVIKITFFSRVSSQCKFHTSKFIIVSHKLIKVLAELTTIHGGEAMLEDMWMAKHYRDRSRESTAVIERVRS